MRDSRLLAGATCIAAAVALATAHLAHAKKPAPPADEYDFLIVSYDAYGGWWPFAWSGQHSGDGPTVPPVAGHTFGGSEHMPASETLTLESYWNGGAVIELTGLTYTTTPAKRKKDPPTTTGVGTFVVVSATGDYSPIAGATGVVTIFYDYEFQLNRAVYLDGIL